MNTAKESGNLRDTIEDGRSLLRKIERERDGTASGTVPLTETDREKQHE